MWYITSTPDTWLMTQGRVLGWRSMNGDSSPEITCQAATSHCPLISGTLPIGGFETTIRVFRMGTTACRRISLANVCRRWTEEGQGVGRGRRVYAPPRKSVTANRGMPSHLQERPWYNVCTTWCEASAMPRRNLNNTANCFRRVSRTTGSTPPAVFRS